MRRVLLGNFTVCGPSLSKFLLEHPHDAALAAEMHVPQAHVQDWAASFGGMGWISDWAPSQEATAATEARKLRAAEVAAPIRRRVRGKTPPKVHAGPDRARRTGGAGGHYGDAAGALCF